MHHDLTYFLGMIPHVIGIAFAIFVFSRHEDKFQASSLSEILTSRVEQHCVLLILSVGLNVLAVFQILPRWLAERPVLYNDLWYISYHVSVGAFVIVSNIMALQELNKMGTIPKQGELV